MRVHACVVASTANQYCTHDLVLRHTALLAHSVAGFSPFISALQCVCGRAEAGLDFSSAGMLCWG
jgi:hypothetical protein